MKFLKVFKFLNHFETCLMHSSSLNKTAAKSAKAMRLTPEDIKRIRKSNPRARIMEVKHKPLPNLGTHTRTSLKDPSSEDGGLVPWIKKCASMAKCVWERKGYSKGQITGKDVDAFDRIEKEIMQSIQHEMMKEAARTKDQQKSGTGMSRDVARCIGFPKLLRAACSMRVFQSPQSLDGIFMIIDAHRKITNRQSRIKSLKSGAQKRLDQAKIKALAQANAIFEGRSSNLSSS